MRSWTSFHTLLILSLHSAVNHAFSPLASDRLGRTCSDSYFSRRQIFDYVAITAISCTMALPTVARADISSELASPGALRTMKRIQKKLSSFELYAVDNDYTSLKGAFRQEPFSDLRKTCGTLIKAGEGKPEAEAMQDSYKVLVANLEKVDSLASLGFRGRKLGETELFASYKALVQSLDDFVRISEQVTAIP